MDRDPDRGPSEPVDPGEIATRPNVGESEASIEARRRRDEVRMRLFGEPPETLKIGRFSLLSRIGAGGMGVVYTAYDGELDRTVALKLVRSSAAGGQETLMREAQAMARVSHPNVAVVHEVGLWDGRVFVAMELVRGETLRAWMAAKREVREVIAVFAQAGRGLAAAHEHNLVHRDFKPENVMIGRDGRARVVDFGLARAASLDAGEGAREPAGGLCAITTATVAGTPAYMAPEQHAGKKVDARADQFSFCVALYEALYGERPFAGDTYDELRTRVERGEVRAAPRGARVPAQIREALLRGLARSPAERFPSMDALVDELTRDPAEKRRRALVIAGLTIAAAAAIAGLWRADRAACTGAPEKIAEVWGDAQQTAVRKALSGAKTEDEYPRVAWLRAASSLDTYAKAWGAMHVDACRANRRGDQSDELLDLRMVCLERRRAELGAAARVLSEGGPRVVERAAEIAGGLTPLAECADAATLRAEVRPPKSPEAAKRVEEGRASLAEARVELHAGQHAKSAERAAAVAAVARRLEYAPLTAEALALLGAAQKRAGQYPEAISALEEAFERSITARHDRAAADAAVQLFTVMAYHQARFEVGAAWEQVASALVARAGDRRVEADFFNNRALVRQERGQLDEALADYRRVRAIYEELFGPRHASVARTLGNLAAIPFMRGRYEEARAALRETLALEEEVNGASHPAVARTLTNLATVEIELGLTGEAIDHARRAVTLYETSLGREHAELALALDNLGGALTARGEPEEALVARERGLSILRAKPAASGVRVAMLLQGSGATLRALGRGDEARARVEEALALREKRLGPEHPDTVETSSLLGDLLLDKGRADEAEDRYRKAISILERKLGNDHPALAAPLAGLGRARLARGDAAEATSHLSRAEQLAGGAAWKRGPIRLSLARALSARGDEAAARDRAARAAEDLESAGGRHKQRAAEARAFGAGLGER